MAVGGIGHDFTATFENVSVSAAAQDLFELTAASAVPVVLKAVRVTCGTTSQEVARIQVLLRSTAGSGGSSVTARALNPAGPSASSTVNRTVTTVGSAGNTYASDQWNVVVPYELNLKPDGILIAAGTRIAVGLMAALGGSRNMSATLEFTELK